MKSWLQSADPEQLAALEFIAGRDIAGLLLPPGYGKTAITLAALRAAGQPALVICPLRPLYATWPKETRKWVEFDGLRTTILHGPRREDALDSDADIYLVNPENFEWVLNRKDWPFKTLVVDESSKFKNSATARFKTLRRHLDRFQARYILTGSPMPRTLEDVFAQVYILDGGQRLGQYITHFRRRYMVDVAPPRSDWSSWVAAPGAREEVLAKISDICLSLPDDHTPPARENIIEVELPPAARRQYKTMEAELWAEIDAGVVTAVNAGAKTMKLRQLTAGFIYDGGEGHLVHSAKFDALMDLIDELSGDPVLIGVQFRWEAEEIQRRVKRAFGEDIPYMGSGGLPAKQMVEMIRQWNAGELRAVVAHPASAGHGIDELQIGGRHVCWFTHTYNYEEYDQLTRRIQRRGQKRDVMVHKLVATDTIDEVVLSMNEAKASSQTAFMEALQRRKP